VMPRGGGSTRTSASTNGRGCAGRRSRRTSLRSPDPLVADSVVLNLFSNGEISLDDFIVRAAGVTLTADGRHAVLRAYERRPDIKVRHPIFGYRLRYRRLLDVQTRLLAAHVLGEILPTPVHHPLTDAAPPIPRPVRNPRPQEASAGVARDEGPR
jgi:hypothetical protein